MAKSSKSRLMERLRWMALGAFFVLAMQGARLVVAILGDSFWAQSSFRSAIEILLSTLLVSVSLIIVLLICRRFFRRANSAEPTEYEIE
jgi:hypothetical protein